ncbi:MAG: polysaccharide pyruvyl transferase family protein, partial [Candidatus Sabulitectum sp.]|nr:polysaccharide pyruvyl transferase family protein [Candidatus Sabulitectum sp.]
VKFADPSQPDEFVRFISRCRVLVTTPLHGAIMSVATGTVPVSVSYASKCTRFMEQIGLQDSVPPGETGIPGKAVVAAVEKAWVNSERISARMTPVRNQLIQRAEKTAEYFRKLFRI